MIVVLMASLALAEAPAVLAGRYEVDRVQLRGERETQDFTTYMQHQAMASGDACHTLERHYDFGVAPEGQEAWRPSRVTVHETVTCTRGGLGTYHLDASLEMPARWTGEGLEVMVLDGGTVIGRVTRLERPRDVGVPALWVGERQVHAIEPAEMTFEGAAGRRRGRPSLRATLDGEVFLLNPVEAVGAP